MKPSVALGKQAKAQEVQAQTLVSLEAKIDQIMAKLGIVPVEVVSQPEIPAEAEPEVVDVSPAVIEPVEAQDKPAKKKK